MSAQQTVLAFDIGIRNLAWCLLRRGTGEQAGELEILGWQNYDLLSGQGHETAKAGKVKCCRCSVGAAFWNTLDGIEAPTCLRHCPVARPPLKEVATAVVGAEGATAATAATPYKRLPKLQVLKELLAATAGPSSPPLKKSASKTAVLEALAARHSLPLEKVKVKKAVEHDIALLHDAIRTFLLSRHESFREATQILLENQPVLKNPTMKTVQILLFATLRDVLQPAPPPLKLVHAGKKVKGKATGDAGYKSRKDASEEAVIAILKEGKIRDAARWLTHFEAQAKRSDLADAFCMCCDALGLVRPTAPTQRV
jgi:hypothetical protein